MLMARVAHRSTEGPVAVPRLSPYLSRAAGSGVDNKEMARGAGRVVVSPACCRSLPGRNGEPAEAGTQEGAGWGPHLARMPERSWESLKLKYLK